jgi:hypothetical protein
MILNFTCVTTATLLNPKLQKIIPQIKVIILLLLVKIEDFTIIKVLGRGGFGKVL